MRLSSKKDAIQKGAIYYYGTSYSIGGDNVQPPPKPKQPWRGIPRNT